MGGLTIIIARLRALFEIDVKKIVALSTLSQLGVIRLGVGIELPIIAFLHLLIHAYFKAIIFIIVGQLIYFSLGYQSINFMGRLGVARPVMIGGFLIGGFSLIGIPFMAAFYSKEPIIEILFTRNFFAYWLFFNIEGSLPHLSLQPPPPLIVRNFPSSALFNYSSSRENKKNHKDISSVSSFFFQGCHFF